MSTRRRGKALRINRAEGGAGVNVDVHGHALNFNVRTRCRLRGAGRVANTATSAGRKQTGKATTAAAASGLRVRDKSYKDCESKARTDSSATTVRRSTAVSAAR